MRFVNSRPVLGTRQQTLDVITRDKATKGASVKERHKTAVGGTLLLHLLGQNVISSHDKEAGNRKEQPAHLDCTVLCFLLESRV
jgi:hypothetical protein